MATKINRAKTGKGNPPKHSRFKPGTSGNPNGRPKKIPIIDDLLADILCEEKNGITTAKAILSALCAKAAKGDVRAAEVILERAYGKIKQPIENTGNQELTIRIVRSQRKSSRSDQTIE